MVQCSIDLSSCNSTSHLMRKKLEDKMKRILIQLRRFTVDYDHAHDRFRRNGLPTPITAE